MNAAYLRLLFSETLWLEPAHYNQAKAVGTSTALPKEDNARDELKHWKSYISALVCPAFKGWIEDKLPNARIQAVSNECTDAGYLNVDGFRLCVLTLEHVLDEVVRLPKDIVEKPELVAHYYVVVEVLEDQQEAVIRGCARHDELIIQLKKVVSPLSALPFPDEYLLPLSFLDTEINHLLGYIQHLHPSEILLPQAFVLPPLKTTVTCLSHWLETTLTEGWQTLDRLVNLEASLAWSTRHYGTVIKGGKLINLGMQLGAHPIALLITVTPEAEKIGVNVQILPAGEDSTLPPALTVILRSSTNKILQEVMARSQDSYIQLRPFRGRPGIRFTLEVLLNDVTVSEAFEL